jgi:RNA polymerase sigma factor (sigma-70 family)
MHLNGKGYSGMIQAKDIPDEIVVKRVLAGEVELFELIMRRHNRKLYRIARGMGVSDADAADMIQQTYVQAYTNLAGFKQSSTVSTWLVRILINTCLMERRRPRLAITTDGILEDIVDQQPAATHEQTTPESAMIKNELRKVLEEAINRLPDDYRIVYMMREMEGMSIRDTATALGLTEVNVKVRALRARRMLREELGKYLRAEEIFEFGSSRCDAIVGSVLKQLQSSSK